MFRLWAKEFKDNRMLRDTVICDDTEDTRTHKVFHALDEICHEFDLSQPVCWVPISGNFSGTQRSVFIRTVLSIRSSLIIWSCR